MEIMAKFIVDIGLIPSRLRGPLLRDDETVVYTFGCALHPFPLHPMIPSQSIYVFFGHDSCIQLFRLTSHYGTLRITFFSISLFSTCVFPKRLAGRVAVNVPRLQDFILPLFHVCTLRTSDNLMLVRG